MMVVRNEEPMAKETYRSERFQMVLTPMERKHLDLLSIATGNSLSLLVRAALQEFVQAVITGLGGSDLSKRLHGQWIAWQLREIQDRLFGKPGTPGLPDDIEASLQGGAAAAKETLAEIEETKRAEFQVQSVKN